MNVKRIAFILTGGALLLGTATACSGVDTAPDQIALHYSGGTFDSQNFVDCVPASTNLNTEDPGDHFYVYPAGRRTFKFSDTKDSDSPPIEVATKDNQEMTVRGVFAFNLDTTCKELRAFHEQVGKKYKAYTGDGVDPIEGTDHSQGWINMLTTYLKDPGDRSMDAAAQTYDWQSLYNNPTIKTEWEKKVLDPSPEGNGILTQVKRFAGSDYFKNLTLLIQKPDPSNVLKEQLTNKQAAVLRGQAAEVDKQSASSFPGGLPAYIAYQRQLAVNKAIESGKVQVIPVPDGVSLQIQVPKNQ